MHDPLVHAVLGVLRVLDVADLAVLVEVLHGHALQGLRVAVVAARVDEALDLAVLDVLEDDVLLRLHAVVALDLVVDHIAVGRIGPRHDVLVEGDCTDADEKAHDDGRRGDAVKTDATRLHGRDLARAREASECQERREQHGHREGPHDDRRQAKDEDLDDGRQRCAVIRDVLGDLEERTRTDEDSRECADAEDEGLEDLPEYVFV